MEALEKTQLVAFFTSRKISADIASIYVDAFNEYRKAMANINENGSVVQCPRTGTPIDNPFLKVRDRAQKTLVDMSRRVKHADAFWQEFAK